MKDSLYTASINSILKNLLCSKKTGYESIILLSYPVSVFQTIGPYQKHTFCQYQPGGETFSFFCDSGELLEILNFLPDTQDLGHTVCRMKKPGSPKGCLPVPLLKTCQNAMASGTAPFAATVPKQKILRFFIEQRRNRERNRFSIQLVPAEYMSECQLPGFQLL